MTFSVKLGRSGKQSVSLDAFRLLESRALVCGSSGCGKSWLLRLIAEQTAPQLPTLVLDPEGEFITLREAVDVALVSAEGDVRPSVAAAPTIARRLLELGTSAVVALDDLAPLERKAFVRGFIEGLMDAPRSSWRPLLVILDEAHDYAPQTGEASSGGAVARLLSQGRKRGYGTILSTQRLSKLHKDAAAECANVLVGRTTLGIDLARARDLLGLHTQNEARELRKLRPGEWRAVGPALDPDDAGELVAGAVKTTHPQPGHRHELAPPAPSTKLRKKLAELADVAEATKDEILTLEQAKARIAELERGAVGRAGASSAELAAAREQGRREVEAEKNLYIAVRMGKFAEELEQLGRAARREEQRLRGFAAGDARAGMSAAANPVARDPSPRRSPTSPPSRAPAGAPSGGLRRLLIVLAQHPDGCDRRQLALLARLSTKGGTFGTYLSSARTRRWLFEHDDKRLQITEKGRSVIGRYEPLPEGRELIDHWLAWCGGEDSGQRRMLEELIRAGEAGLGKDELARRARIERKGGSFGTYLSRLRTAQLVDGRDELRAAPALLEAAR